MSKSRAVAWVIAALVLFAGWTMSTPVRAADADLKIGVVDTEKLMNSPRFKQYDEEVTAFGQSLEVKLTIRNQKLMLNEAEIKELIELKTKPKATPQEEARIKELEEIERQRDAELKTLQETKELTDQQKARLKELQDMRQKSKDTGEALHKDYQEQLRAKVQSLDAQFAAEAQEAIKQVAEARGLVLVLNKMSVLYGGIDISDDVTAKLDRKIQ